MVKVKAIFLFYKKLMVPSLLFSILIGVFSIYMSGQFSATSFGLSYLLLPLLMHYFIYEVRNKNEYFFYHNLGLSKLSLWISTLIISLLGAVIISILTWIVYRQIVY